MSDSSTSHPHPTATAAQDARDDSALCHPFKQNIRDESSRQPSHPHSIEDEVDSSFVVHRSHPGVDDQDGGHPIHHPPMPLTPESRRR